MNALLHKGRTVLDLEKGIREFVVGTGGLVTPITTIFERTGGE